MTIFNHFKYLLSLTKQSNGKLYLCFVIACFDIKQNIFSTVSTITTTTTTTTTNTITTTTTYYNNNYYYF